MKLIAKLLVLTGVVASYILAIELWEIRGAMLCHLLHGFLAVILLMRIQSRDSSFRRDLLIQIHKSSDTDDRRAIFVFFIMSVLGGIAVFVLSIDLIDPDIRRRFRN